MKTFFLAAVILLGMLAWNVQAWADRFWLDTLSGVTWRYRIHGKDTRHSWYQCKEYCKRSATGAYILTINNAREAEWVNNKSEIHQWIGPNDGSVYNWAVDDPHLNYDNWWPQQYINMKENCVTFWEGGVWYNQGCGAKRTYVCKKGLGTKTACDSGWEKRETYCYKFSRSYGSPNSHKTWKDARSDCLSKAADLAWIENKDENLWVYRKTGEGWIGLNDLHRKRQWVWSKFGNYDSLNFIVPVEDQAKYGTRTQQCYIIAKQGNVWKKHKGRCLYDSVGYTCEMPLIDINGGWGAWSQYSGCSITCGGRGVLTSTRKCNDPPPGNNGKNCVGNSTRTTQCTMPDCAPVNGGLSQWGSWSACSRTCGVGQHTRTRTCSKPAPAHGGTDCVGDLTQTTSCNERSCQVDGGWSGYTCTKTRTRTCTNPAPANGGANCKGDLSDTASCDDNTWNTNP